MRLGSRFAVAAALAGAALAAGDARAVGTRSFELDSLEKLSGGDLKGASVGSDGVVRAGWTLGSVPLPDGAGDTIKCAAALADGSVLVGTAGTLGGKVVRFAGDQATILADTKESSVNALAVDRAGSVFAGTTGSKIYKVSQGRADVFATLSDAESVWALAVDRAGGALFAGTGSDGKIVRVEPGGAQSVYFKTDDPFVVSLAVGDDGALYAGTSGKALLYRVAAAGRASVLYDFGGGDVHAIAVGPGKTLFAIANEGPATSSSESSESSSRHSGGGRTPAGPSAPPRSKPGKGSLWRFDARGRPERLMHHDEFHYVSLAVDERGAPYVGTGAEGRVYTVDDAHVVSLVADTDERQVGALLVSGKTRVVVGSDPAALHRVVSVGGAGATWTSKPLDAGLRARFGHLTWRGTGALEVATRTGDTQTPDATWSAWSNTIPQGGATPSPAGRFVQVRAKLADANATIADVVVPFMTENLRAVVTEVTAHPKGAAREGKESGITPSGAEPPKHESVLHVTWKVDNPDGDELRYRVMFRREGFGRWISATRSEEVLTKAELDWDTSTLPEGKYRLRIDATDDISNPPESVTAHALESAPVLVDNTPPVFKTIGVQGKRLRAEVVDGVGPIVRVELAFDGAVSWRPLGAADGILDTADESIDVDLGPIMPPATMAGPHVIAVRAFDAAGNAAVREIETP
jgi:hypothetical protein